MRWAKHGEFRFVWQVWGSWSDYSKSCGKDIAMNAAIQPLSEVNQRAKNILIQERGAIDAVRFLNQFQVGSGDCEYVHLP